MLLGCCGRRVKWLQASFGRVSISGTRPFSFTSASSLAIVWCCEFKFFLSERGFK